MKIVEKLEKVLEHVKASAKKDDNETAHNREKDLWEYALLNIANGCEDPQEVAKKALESSDVEFDRQYS